MKLGKNSYIRNEDYHADNQYLSSSQLKLLLTDHYAFRKKYILKEKMEDEIGDTSFFDYGTYVHLAILEPHLLESEAIILEEDRLNYKTYETYSRYYKGDILKKADFFKNKTDYENLVKNNPGKVIITKGEQFRINLILDKVKSMPYFQFLLRSGEKEETICSVVKGVNVKCRWDLLGSGYGLDIKTSSFKITPDAVQLTCLKRDYALSAAMYMEVTKAAGFPVNDFYFLFINKITLDISLLKANNNFIEHGKRQFYEAINKFKHFEKMGFFNLQPQLEVLEQA